MKDDEDNDKSTNIVLYKQLGTLETRPKQYIQIIMIWLFIQF